MGNYLFYPRACFEQFKQDTSAGASVLSAARLCGWTTPLGRGCMLCDKGTEKGLLVNPLAFTCLSRLVCCATSFSVTIVFLVFSGESKELTCRLSQLRLPVSSCGGQPALE